MQTSPTSATLPPSGRMTFKARLQQAPGWVFVLYLSLSSFVVYACMDGFRKPFTAASFDGYTLWDMHYKLVLVISQVIGYALSKFLGIRFVAGMKPENRMRYIL